MARLGFCRINFAWGLFERVWPVLNSKMKSAQRSRGLVNPNQFTDPAIELWDLSQEDGCPTQVPSWLSQGLYGSGWSLSSGTVKSSLVAPGFVVNFPLV